MSDPTRRLPLLLAIRSCGPVESGVTITDAAVDGQATAVFCNLLDDGQRRCPDAVARGSIAIL